MKKGLYRLATIPRLPGSLPLIQSVGWMPDHFYVHREHQINALFICFVLREEPGCSSTIINGREFAYNGGAPHVSLVLPGSVMTTVHALKKDELFFIYKEDSAPFWRNYFVERRDSFVMTSRFRKLLDEVFENLNDLHAPGRADQLDLLVLRMLLEIKMQKQQQLESREEQEVRRIASMLAAHFQEPLSIPELLRGSGLSTRSFYRLWNSFYDESPMEMLQAKRMFAAEQRLSTTDMRIQEIADLCGFSSPVYFYQRFLKMHGCSPAEYRKRKAFTVSDSAVPDRMD